MGSIINEDTIPRVKRELYSGIFEYSVPYGYEFWSGETNFGNRIYAREVTDNDYIVKKNK